MNIYNIKFTNNILRWFKKNLPIKYNNIEWINIKKSFIYGFNLNYTAIYDNVSCNNLLYSRILNNTFLSKNNNLFVYISNTDNINIIIDTNIETLIELNLNYYNPSIKKYFYKNVLINKFTNKFIDNYYYSISKKQYNISHVIYHKNTNKSSSILDKNNNLIPHIIKMWTNDYLPNHFYDFITDPKSNILQKGGNNEPSNHLSLFKLIYLSS